MAEVGDSWGGEVVDVSCYENGEHFFQLRGGLGGKERSEADGCGGCEAGCLGWGKAGGQGGEDESVEDGCYGGFVVSACLDELG